MSGESNATGVTVSSNVATERSESYSSEGYDSSYERSEAPAGTGGTTTVEVGGDVKAEGAGYSAGVDATATGEGSTTTVTTTGSVEATSGDNNAAGVYASSNVATENSYSSSSEGDTYSTESSYAPVGTGGTTTVEVGGGEGRRRSLCGRRSGKCDRRRHNAQLKEPEV